MASDRARPTSRTTIDGRHLPAWTGRSSKLARVAALGVSFAATGILVDACVIAEPPSELPQLPEMRPTIVRASVVPSAALVLGRWPTTFIVPVELSNPLSDIAWATFVDYNPATGAGLKQSDIATAEPSSTSGRIRTLALPIARPPDDGCHIVEVVVGLRLNTFNGITSHTPEPPGGDVVSWFYNPSGDIAGCPVLDAGLAPVVDAEAGVEAGGTEQ